MSKKRVLDVGNCCVDHNSIKRMLQQHFDVEVLQADDLKSTLEVLRSTPVDLVLVNRKLDIDYSDGIEIIRALKRDPEFNDIPVMLVTNYPEHQQAAMQEGALEGFGKLALNDAATIDKLRDVLGTTTKTAK